MSRPQAVDTDVASGGGRPCDDSSAPVAHLRPTGCTTCTTCLTSAVSTYAGGRRGKERAASLRAEQRLAAGGRRLPRPGLVTVRRLPRPGRVKHLADAAATGGDAAVAG